MATLKTCYWTPVETLRLLVFKVKQPVITFQSQFKVINFIYLHSQLRNELIYTIYNKTSNISFKLNFNVSKVSQLTLLRVLTFISD